MGFKLASSSLNFKHFTIAPFKLQSRLVIERLLNIFICYLTVSPANESFTVVRLFHQKIQIIRLQRITELTEVPICPALPFRSVTELRFFHLFHPSYSMAVVLWPVAASLSISFMPPLPSSPPPIAPSLPVHSLFLSSLLSY